MDWTHENTFAVGDRGAGEEKGDRLWRTAEHSSSPGHTIQVSRSHQWWMAHRWGLQGKHAVLCLCYAFPGDVQSMPSPSGVAFSFDPLWGHISKTPRLRICLIISPASLPGSPGHFEMRISSTMASLFPKNCINRVTAWSPPFISNSEGTILC